MSPESAMPDDPLAFYTRPAVMTDPGPAAAFARQPADIPALCGLVHGVLLHQHWARAYGQQLTPERIETAHLRRVRDLCGAIRALDPSPLTVARPPERRVVGVCQHFTVLACAALRAAGIPARARCGFGTYFEPGKGVDHWIAEYWDGRRWVAADFQIDAVQAAALHPDFDVLDQPRGKFLRAGEAWRACRRGERDANAFGIFGEGGFWFIAQNLIRDVAALNNMEMLPWDVWGAMPKPDDEITPALFTLFDHLAELTADPDAGFTELRHAYEKDIRLHVPAEVFNAVRRRVEPVVAGG
ncbi:transglutaminase-like domain-containing protein [Bradyrhizobium iriomotense]|uniref:Transglutaminase-like domain-containing protein n=1 Tax=Bradyrhizobium iriomotense TaxID=441950 RepID=A0ABQ6B087_9BRAD|nr:transglutaminase-like domain-containing protein [Bradyrhizobium iriomotense]GLR87847.1 hypothetical protein GCM10007857_45590 [Bradyrhizobium iriomotense]